MQIIMDISNSFTYVILLQ